MADVNPDKTVRLAPDRWRALREHFGCGEQLEVFEVLDPVEIADVVYLPGVYRAA